MQFINPETVVKPRGPYSQAVKIVNFREMLFVSGQVALRPDGTIPAGIEAQADLVWSNIGRTLAQAEMTIRDVAKVTCFLTSRDLMACFGAVRQRYLGDHRPASTLIIAQALANPEYLVEVEVIAAR